MFNYFSLTQNVSFTYKIIILLMIDTNPLELCSVKLCEELFINNQYNFTLSNTKNCEEVAYTLQNICPMF